MATEDPRHKTMVCMSTEADEELDDGNDMKEFLCEK